MGSMVEKTATDLSDVLDLRVTDSLLDTMAASPDAAVLMDAGQARIVVDFTFRLPPAVLDEIRDMARDRGCTVNAMMAGLVDLGLQARGRPGIAARHPEYVAYLQRGRRGVS